MSGQNRANGKRRATTAARPIAITGAETWLRQAVVDLQREVIGRENADVTAAIVAFGTQPDLWAAMCQRADRKVAVQDLIVRRAFELLYVHQRSIHELDGLSQRLVAHTLDLIYTLADAAGEQHGANPLDVDDRLLMELGEQISHHTLHKSLAAHIRFRMARPEDPVREFVQKFEYLVTRPEIADAFVAFVHTVVLPRPFRASLRQLAAGENAHKTDDRLEQEFRAQLQSVARGDRGVHVHPEAIIRFFALADTVAFVKRFADRQQTARALYAADEYDDVPWRGARRPQRGMRQGFLDRALAQVEARCQTALDTEDGDRHELIGADEEDSLPEVRVAASLPEWITRTALTRAPQDPLWRASQLLYIEGLTPERITAYHLAAPETLAQAQAQMHALLADPAVQRAWQAATEP
ncbi:MAG: hypothetical protein KIT87_27860 [Anaerolineae bacterium]|nr:hypothetical protein [Anaerolineae bacterium]